MPTSEVRAARRAAGLCVECPTPSKTARCPPCKARERRRSAAAKAHGPGVSVRDLPASAFRPYVALPHERRSSAARSFLNRARTR